MRKSNVPKKIRRVSIDLPDENSPLVSGDDDSRSDDGLKAFAALKPTRVSEPSLKPTRLNEALAAERLSMRLLEVDDEDSDAEDQIIRETLDLSRHGEMTSMEMMKQKEKEKQAREWFCTMLSLGILTLAVLGTLVYLGVEFVGPPNQPIGPYRLIERQEGEEFFNYYNFYEGRDSAGSNGYNKYVGREKAQALGIFNITHEPDILDDNKGLEPKLEPYIYMGSAPTKQGPRDSIRLEGKRRFGRGLFIIDLRHMPAGCGVWPAFWLTDEANWPVNGEIDIVEGVNYQSVAKTALHSTKGCVQDDIPMGVKTGSWDTAVGIPDRDTGVPDMTLRYATNCFVYDPHQWLNQGCVAVDEEGDTLGIPVNRKGGGVYVLEWDPINRHIRSWVFSPHSNVPENLKEVIRTASEPDEENRVAPDPESWPLPYGFFAIGQGTNCPASHFRNMRLVFNLAFCGSVAGNRYHLDCVNESKVFDTCNDWIQSEPSELAEAYWKIRGVYVYEREWERAFV